MAGAKSVWGIDIGQCSVKAIKLREVDGEVQVDAFDIIEHPRVLTQPDVDVSQLIHNALEQFLARNSVAGSQVRISVPGQTSFTRFVKLPPVEPKKIPEIVRYEADQQIPFDMNEVIWQWQTFQSEDSPDVDVGIFAIKRSDVASMLEHFNDAEIPVDAVQMAPLALYNFMTFDGQEAESGATLLVDMGAAKTDLVVSDGTRIWTRTIQIGGNSFTESLVRAFKLSFHKAEKLKRTAATSKYARQIFQAMRPVFADLVQEIQRSVGYYTSMHRDTKFNRLLGLGNGFRLPGLQKFLEQNLSIPVVRVDSFKQLRSSPEINAPVFTENVLSFAVAYGLALQGLGLTIITTNLLPVEIARKRRWKKKNPWFIGAAACVLAALGMTLFSAKADQKRLAPVDDLPANSALIQAKDISKEMDQWKKELAAVKRGAVDPEAQEELFFGSYGYRDYWPSVLNLIYGSIEQVAVDQPKLGDTESERTVAIKALQTKPRNRRRMITVTSFKPVFYADITKASLSGKTKAAPIVQRRGRGRNRTKTKRAPSQRGYIFTVNVRMPLGKQESLDLIDRLLKCVDANAAGFQSLKVLDHSFQRVGATGSGGAKSNRIGGYANLPGSGNTQRPSRPTAKADAKIKAQKPDHGA